MKNSINDLLLVNGINGASIAVLTLNDVKDIVAIVLGLVSTISTLLIIRENLRKAGRKSYTEGPSRTGNPEKHREAQEGKGDLKGELHREHRDCAENAEGCGELSSHQVIRVKEVALIAAGLLLTGCTHAAGKRVRMESALARNEAAVAEESRVLTTAVVDVLGRAETSNAVAQVALELAKADQVLEGMPIGRMAIDELLARDARAWEAWREREEDQRRLLLEGAELRSWLRAAEERLIAFGERYEAERNTHIVKRFWRWLIGSLGIGGVIALCVLCPAVIPVLGSLMSWVVGKVPSLAGYFGVVSKKAFDGVVKGVGEFRRVAAETKEKTRLDEELLKATDEEHRELIQARRRALRV